MGIVVGIGRGYPEFTLVDTDDRHGGGRLDIETSVTRSGGDRVRWMRQEPGVLERGKASTKRSPSRGDEGVTRSKSGSPVFQGREEVTTFHRSFQPISKNGNLTIYSMDD